MAKMRTTIPVAAINNIKCYYEVHGKGDAFGTIVLWSGEIFLKSDILINSINGLKKEA